MISAFCFLAQRRIDTDSYRMFGVISLARSGDEKAVKEQVEAWEEELS